MSIRYHYIIQIFFIKFLERSNHIFLPLNAIKDYKNGPERKSCIGHRWCNWSGTHLLRGIAETWSECMLEIAAHTTFTITIKFAHISVRCRFATWTLMLARMQRTHSA